MSKAVQLSAPVNQIEALFQKAEAFRKEKKYPQAINAYIQVVLYVPGHWLAYYNLGLLFNEIKKEEAALIALQRAVAINQEQAPVWVALGALLRRAGRHADAEDAFLNAISCEEDSIHALFNLGEMLLRTNKTERSLEYFEKILAGEKDADDIKAISRWLRAVARLTLGDYQNAWEDYEARIYHPTTLFPELIGERWVGQPVKGKRIFLAYEQRFGDVIQFVRFVPKLVEMGAEIYLQTPPQLMRLFECLGEGVHLVRMRDPLPEYDYCQLVTSIPAILNYHKKDVGMVGYLRTNPQVDVPAFPVKSDTSLKVGLIWAGKPKPDRSMPLKHYIPLLRHKNVSFYSFQLGPARKDLRKHAVDWLIHDLSGDIKDFHDSSLFMKEMDLVITVDTAAAHQAGALGVPVWLMLIYYSDWRWGMTQDDTTAWYPTMKIIRQTKFRSWDEAAEKLHDQFDQWVANQAVDEAETTEEQTAEKISA